MPGQNDMPVGVPPATPFESEPKWPDDDSQPEKPKDTEVPPATEPTPLSDDRR